MSRPEPVADLDWGPGQARELTGAMLDLWCDLLERMRDMPVAPPLDEASVARKAALPVPDEPLSTDQLAGLLRPLVMENSTLCGHPGFMAYISGSGTVPGAAADLLAAALNPNVGGWSLAPAATEVELHLTRWLAERFGLPAGRGRADDERRRGLEHDRAQGRTRREHPRRRAPGRHRRPAPRALRLRGGPRHHRRVGRPDGAGRAGGARDPHRRGLPHARRRPARGPGRRPRRRHAAVRGGRDRGHHGDRRGRPAAGDRRPVRRARPVAARRRRLWRCGDARARSCDRCWPVSSGPTRSRSIRTSGCTRRSRARACSCATRAACCAASRSTPPTSATTRACPVGA